MLIGNSQPHGQVLRSRGTAGFTFLEIMAALVILSLGIVAIYRAFLFSLGVESHLRHRLHALALLEDRLARIEKLYNDERRFSPRLRNERIVERVGQKEMVFQLVVVAQQGMPLKEIEQVNVQLAWDEQDHFYVVRRSLFFYRPRDEGKAPES